MRCGGTCHECKDTSLSLDLCKRFGWIQMTANQSEKGVQCLGEDFLIISKAMPKLRKRLELRLRFQMSSPRSFQRLQDIYSRSSRSTRGDSTDEASTSRHPETDEASTSRHPEDERDQKLREGVDSYCRKACKCH